MEVIEGVPETLEYLAERHDLTLFTKGHAEEQKLKIDRSGLGGFFAHTAIVKEKDAAAIARLVESAAWMPARDWMIGNSPKSDINPALEAGLNAVFVPHAHTWVLEKQDLCPEGPPAGAGEVRRSADEVLASDRGRLSPAKAGDQGKPSEERCQRGRLGKAVVGGIELYGINASTIPTVRIVCAGEVGLGGVGGSDGGKYGGSKIAYAHIGCRPIK